MVSITNDRKVIGSYNIPVLADNYSRECGLIMKG